MISKKRFDEIERFYDQLKGTKVSTPEIETDPQYLHKLSKRDTIKIHCPQYRVSHEDISQVVFAGIETSNVCDYIHLPADETSWHKWKLAGNDPAPITKDCPADVILIHGNAHPEKSLAFRSQYPNIPCIVLDYKDKAELLFTKLNAAEKNTYYFKRSLVAVDHGIPSNVVSHSPYDVKHGAFCVREDIYEMTKKLNPKRDIDVSCFFEKTWWPKNVETYQDMLKCDKFIVPDGDIVGGSRGYIPIVVSLIPGMKKHVGKTAKHTQGDGRKGKDIDIKGSMQYNYVETMMRSKMIVTACPSNYEGDYRLMEAMVSGALVFHNYMMLPPIGLTDGVHYIVYKTPIDLANKIQYYHNNPQQRDKIAKTGKEFVLNNHRPKHRIEQFLKESNII